MKPPRQAEGGRGQAGRLDQSLTEKGGQGVTLFSVTLKTPKKPLKPLGYSPARPFLPSGTAFEYTASVLGLVENGYPQNPPKTSGLLATRSRTLSEQSEKHAPSEQKTAQSAGGVLGGSPRVLGGKFSSLPFTPDPRREYCELCEYHASLSEYIEREAPEMRASGQADALGELEKIAGAMLDRLSELEALGAHLGSAGGRL